MSLERFYLRKIHCSVEETIFCRQVNKTFELISCKIYPRLGLGIYFISSMLLKQRFKLLFKNIAIFFKRNFFFQLIFPNSHFSHSHPPKGRRGTL